MTLDPWVFLCRVQDVRTAGGNVSPWRTRILLTFEHATMIIAKTLKKPHVYSLKQIQMDPELDPFIIIYIS
jgi:hypothetical protein